MKKSKKPRVTKIVLEDFGKSTAEHKLCSPPKRVQILTAGAALTTGDRQKVYGEAYDNMKHFAGLLSAYFADKIREEGNEGMNRFLFSTEDAAMIMVLAKNSRIAVGKSYHEDNYVDGATYTAIAGEARDKEEGL